MSAHESRSEATAAGVGVGAFGSHFGRWLMQEFTRCRDLGLTVGIGEQPIVADAMKAGRQHVQQEAAHELVGT